MVDSSDRSDAPDGAGVGSEPATTTGMPRWVKVFGIIAIVFILLVILMLAGVLGGGHGPSRHMGGSHEQDSFFTVTQAWTAS